MSAIACIFCLKVSENLAKLKEHSGTCSKHPAVLKLKSAEKSLYEYGKKAGREGIQREIIDLLDLDKAFARRTDY